jgi:hypothetical protein
VNSFDDENMKCRKNRLASIHNDSVDLFAALRLSTMTAYDLNSTLVLWNGVLYGSTRKANYKMVSYV